MPAPTTSPDPFLAPAERRTLAAVCEALLPALSPEPGDDARLFALDAGSLDLAAAIEGAVGTLRPEQRADFRRLLRLLEQPLVMLPLAGRARSFTGRPADLRERALVAMATSRLEPLRTGFQVLKRLATFLFYSVRPGGGDNPAWGPLGYVRSPRPPAVAAGLSLTAIDGPTTLDADVCVVGSGAGGGVAAAELAAAGRRVVVLEAGGGEQAPDFEQTELEAMRDLYLDRGLAGTRDLTVAILAGATLGGGTTVNWQTSLPLPDAVRDEWAARSGCAFFAEESFGRSLAAVMARAGVQVEANAVNPNNAILREGCRALGWRWREVGRNARGCDPRQCGYCVFGCRHGGKQGVAATFLRDAQERGARIVVRCRARRVLAAGGRATGVAAVATTSAGVEVPVEILAPIVVVACGSIHSPALLLRSGIDLPAVGRHLHIHPATSVAGTYPERIEPWSGPPQSILCDEFADVVGGYGFRLETAPAHPGLAALATPWCGARDHRSEMQTAGRKATVIVLVRDRGCGRVRIARDGAPLVDYRPGRQEIRLLREGIAAVSRVHLALGAESLLALNHRRLGLASARDLPAAVVDAYFAAIAKSRFDRNWTTLFTAHQMGTCRVGSDPKTAVCDATGQVFGLRGLYVADASAFPASSGVNPMITIMALAHHIAGRIADGAA